MWVIWGSQTAILSWLVTTQFPSSLVPDPSTVPANFAAPPLPTSVAPHTRLSCHTVWTVRLLVPTCFLFSSSFFTFVMDDNITISISSFNVITDCVPVATVTDILVKRPTSIKQVLVHIGSSSIWVDKVGFQSAFYSFLKNGKFIFIRGPLLRSHAARFSGLLGFKHLVLLHLLFSQLVSLTISFGTALQLRLAFPF